MNGVAIALSFTSAITTEIGLPPECLSLLKSTKECLLALKTDTTCSRPRVNSLIIHMANQHNTHTNAH
ncbi:hypothetical protein COCCADRAFT_100919 [Bipolaris zeicola 26-R-13]|uniref:Uncharacterized protein n=1 Tax=Cochliobolus carbonum (strain 26-R-13) TaxID=930089 RepID=W6XVT9_COCC2|nr:uncharacterized protein COCCADRAFT_100919 [Bipolaris zeicola 26-R-13]EUC31567.1 hypothetical protein COCCADRAFT_100919 [Bipolaris zeicola 26-R-13]